MVFVFFFVLLVGIAIGLCWKEKIIEEEIKLRKEWQAMAWRLLGVRSRNIGPDIQELSNE